MQPPLPERGMFAALKKKMNNMTFSFMFVSSVQLGGLAQPRHLPKRSPASAEGLLSSLPGTRGLGLPPELVGTQPAGGVAPTCLLSHSIMHEVCCVGLVWLFFSFQFNCGGVYEAVCQKTIGSREPAYTKRVCRSSKAVEPWKPPPFAFAQVKPRLCGWLVKSAEICKEAKHVCASVH